MIRTLLASAVIAAFSVVDATAATLTFAARPATAFDNPLATSFTGSLVENVLGNFNPPNSISPWGNATQPYSTVVGEAIYKGFGMNTVLSLVWGSVNTFNSIEFYNGATKVDTVVGSALAGCCGANNATNSLVTITTVGFTEFRMKSTQESFEYGNLKAVPLPAGGVLLLGALGGIAALRRRKAA